jgi:hypothetical protein
MLFLGMEEQNSMPPLIYFGVDKGVNIKIADRFHSGFLDDVCPGQFSGSFIRNTNNSRFLDSRMRGKDFLQFSRSDLI